MPSIEVVIGLILIILFYSLLATIVMELLSNWMSFRAKHLEKVLRSMLSSKDGESATFEAFSDTALYRQLSGKYYGKNSPPSYLSSDSFRSILMKVLDSKGTGMDMKSRIDMLPDDELRQVLTQLLEDANYQVSAFKANIESWYDDIMDRASGWYKRNVQKALLVVGLVIAVVFNADTLSIYASLASSSKADLDKLVALAETVNEKGSPDGVSGTARANIDREVYELIEMNLQDLKDPLSIGWGGVDISRFTWESWLLKIFGWLVTALCISKGAPFWFDLLKKAVNIRGAGNIPQVVARPVASAAEVSGSEAGVIIKAGVAGEDAVG